jgi:hypothetical protein
MLGGVRPQLPAGVAAPIAEVIERMRELDVICAAKFSFFSDIDVRLVQRFL